MGHPADDADDGADEARAHIAVQGLLEVDAPVALLGEQRPGDSVGENAQPQGEAEDCDDAAHEDEVDAQAPGQASTHATDDAALGAHHPAAAQGIEHARHEGAAGLGGSWLRVRLRGALERCPRPAEGIGGGGS